MLVIQQDVFPINKAFLCPVSGHAHEVMVKPDRFYRHFHTNAGRTWI